MVLKERLSEEPYNEEINEEPDSDEWPDDASSTTSQDQDENKNGCLDIVASNEATPASFGNIVVKDSTEVHFGNKTFYQGPVTIKQFLYNNTPSVQGIEENGHCNDLYVTDGVPRLTNNDTETAVPLDNISKNGLTKNIPPKNEPRPWYSRIRRNYKLLAVLGCILLIIFLVLVTILLVTQHVISTVIVPKAIPEDSPEQEVNTPVDLYDDPDKEILINGKLRIIRRLEWVAQPPVHPLTPLKTPVPFVVILHTATENCTNQAACAVHVRYIQTFHIEGKGWWDIAYSFLVGGDGLAYEGRGWTNEAAIAYGYNARCIGIAFIGTFNNILPRKRQILAAKKLILKGVEEGYIAKDYKLFAHRQLSPTQSPGQMLYEEMQTWPHWSNYTINLDNSTNL